MATATQREQIIALVVGMFDAAPGENYLNQLVIAFDAGATLPAIAAALATKAPFAVMYPPNNTNEEFAAKLVENLLGNNVSAAAKTWSTDWVVAQAAAGMTRAQIILAAVTALRTTTNTNFADAKLELANKVEVATYYSVTKQQSDDNLGDLQNVVATVTKDAATVTAAKLAVDTGAATSTGKILPLTVGLDTVVGGAGNDTINGGTLNTFSAFDSIDGGAGVDTLTILTNAASLPGGVTVKNVENINVNTSVAGAFTANATSYTGVQTLSVTASDQTTGALTVDSASGVTVNSSTATTGAINVGGTTAATGPVSVAKVITGAGNVTGGAVTVKGGTTVNTTTTATNSDLTGTTVTQGNVTVTGTANTTSATVKQSATVAAVTAVTAATESAIVTWQAMAAVAGTQSIGGATITSDGAATHTAAEVATVAAGGTVAGLTLTAPTLWTITADTATTSKFTSTTANTNVTDIGAGAFTGTGNAAPTQVTTQGAAAVTGVGGITAGDVSITDVNSASATAAGTITTVSLENFGAATVNSGALATLNLAGKGTSVAETAGALTTATATTLALNLNGITTTGAVTLDADHKTLNIAAGTANSTLNSLSASGATTVNISGDKTVTLTANTFAATAAITSTNTAGVTIGSAIAAGSTFAGGTGADTITLSASGTKAITMGAGNDTVTYAGPMGTGGSVDAGEGTDSIVMTAAQAATATGSTVFAGTVSNFEVLRLSDAVTTQTINMANADGMNSLNILSSGTALTVTNAAADFTLTQRASSAGTISVALAADTGTSDNVNLAFSAADGFTSTGMTTVTNVESLKITTTDSNTTAQTAVIVTPITAAAAATVTVAGNMGVSLIGGMTQTTLKSLDASGLTASGAFGGLTWTSGILAAAATVKGGAAGTNTIDFSAANAVVTYTGGTGTDTINFASANTKANVVNLGNGTNAFSGATNANGNNTITGGTGTDTIAVGTGANTIDLGGGTTTNSVTVGAAAGLNVITTSSTGVDTFGFTGIQTAAGYYTSLTGWTKGDVINVTGAGSAVSETTLGAKITLGAVSSFANYLDAAVAGNATDAVNWFQFNGNTYLTVDNSANATFADGVDTVIELVGLVDLSLATNVSGVITLA